jgi:hypothetical protein
MPMGSAATAGRVLAHNAIAARTQAVFMANPSER